MSESHDAFLPVEARTVVVIFLSLLLWRLWKFTIRRKLYPLEPKEFPYWIPVFGHVAGFTKDVNAVFEQARQYFKDSKEPYCITAAGTTYYIVTQPRDVSRLHRDTESIGWLEIIKDMHRMLEFSPPSMDAMFTIDPNEEPDQKSGRHLNVNQRIRLRWRDQLHPGAKFQMLKDKTLLAIHQRLDSLFNNESHSITLKLSKDTCTASLLDLSLHVVGGALVENIYGPTIWEVAPAILQDVDTWERCMWKQLYKLPSIFCADVIALRKKLTSQFKAYYALSREARRGAAPVIEEMREIGVEAGFSPDEQGGVALLYLWGVVQNIYKTAFWTVARIAHDTTFREAILEEIRPALVDTAGEIDDEYLATQCPKLESLYFETLRFSMKVFLPRDVNQTTVVGGKTLQKGHTILIPVTQLHNNRDVWGDTPSHFNPARFTQNPKLLKSLSLRPFGAGFSLCPGRFLAKRVVFHFVANLLLRFDFGLGHEGVKEGVNGGFPRYTKILPTGISGAREGDDVVVVMRERGG